MFDKITNGVEEVIDKSVITKEVSSQVEADYELLKIFLQKGDTINALKTIDAIGIALAPNFINAAFLKYSILLKSGREEDARKLAYNMDFLGVSKITVIEKVPSIKSNLAEFFDHKEYLKMSFKSNITENYINNTLLNSQEKMDLLLLFKQFEEDSKNYVFLKEAALNRELGSYDDFNSCYGEEILVDYMHSVMSKELREIGETPINIELTKAMFGLSEFKPGYENLTFEEYLVKSSDIVNFHDKSKRLNYLMKTSDLIKSGKYFSGYFWDIYAHKIFPDICSSINLAKEMYEVQQVYLVYQYFIFTAITATLNSYLAFLEEDNSKK